jgi:hypothetical protein
VFRHQEAYAVVGRYSLEGRYDRPERNLISVFSPLANSFLVTSQRPADYELSSGPTAAAAKSIAAKDFNNFQPARKEVLAMLISLALGEAG